MSKKDGAWPVAKAKAQLSGLIDRAIEEGPQTITRNGRDTVVVVSIKEWQRKSRRKGTLVEFFQNSPLHGSGIKIERIKGGPREIEL